MKIESENPIRRLSFLCCVLDSKMVFAQVYTSAKQLILAIYKNQFIAMDRSINFWQKGKKFWDEKNLTVIKS